MISWYCNHHYEYGIVIIIIQSSFCLNIAPNASRAFSGASKTSTTTWDELQPLYPHVLLVKNSHEKNPQQVAAIIPQRCIDPLITTSQKGWTTRDPKKNWIVQGSNDGNWWYSIDDSSSMQWKAILRYAYPNPFPIIYQFVSIFINVYRISTTSPHLILKSHSKCIEDIIW